jgi:transcriptional regulator with XRE-family HTH domain
MRVKKKLENVTHREVAAAAGIGESHVSLILSGKRQPSLDVALRIARRLRVSVDELARYLEDRRAEREPIAA